MDTQAADEACLEPSREAEAAARLALQILVDFFGAQIAVGAVQPEDVTRLWEDAAEKAIAGAARLEAPIRTHLDRMLIRLHEAIPPDWHD